MAISTIIHSLQTTPMEESSSLAASKLIHSVADQVLMEGRESEDTTTGLPEYTHLPEPFMELEENDTTSQAGYLDLPHLCTRPSYYWTCLNAFLDACPSPDGSHLTYLSCRVHNGLVSAASATMSDESPLRVLSVLGRDTEFDAWTLHNLLLYHSTGLGKTISYDVVRPNRRYMYNQKSSSGHAWSDHESSALSGMFVDSVTGEVFEPIERYDIILMSHSFGKLPPGSLQKIFNFLLTPQEHGHMIVVEAPTKGPYPDCSRSDLDDKLATLDPQYSIYEIISVDGWNEVEDACKDPKHPNVELLSFCTGRDLRRVNKEVLKVIQEEITIQSIIRRCQNLASNPSCFALVYRMYPFPDKDSFLEDDFGL